MCGSEDLCRYLFFRNFSQVLDALKIGTGSCGSEELHRYLLL